MNRIKYNNSVLSFKLSTLNYSESVVFKCFYWYINDYNVDIITHLESFDIKIALKNGNDFDEEALIFRIKNDLIDFKLREIVTIETTALRELITAKAFANYDFNLTEESSFEISDSIGFDPKEIK